MTRSPTGVEPVKATLRTSGWVTSASPATGPVPVHDVEHAGRQPAPRRGSRPGAASSAASCRRAWPPRCCRTAAPGRACCTAASSGSSTARSRRPRRAGGAARGRPRRDRARGRDAPRTAFASPRSAQRVDRLAQLDASPRAASCPARRTSSGTSSSTCASKASAPACRISAAVGDSRGATSRRTRPARQRTARSTVAASAPARGRRPRRSAGLVIVSASPPIGSAAPSMNAPRSTAACGGRRHAHAPTNSGGRFSTNAVRPSTASLERNSFSIELGLEREPVVERQLAALVHAALDRGDRQRRRRRRAARRARDRLASSANSAADEPQSQRLLGRDRAAR